MNSKNIFNLILVIVLIVIIIAMLGLMWYNWPDECDVLQTINASITVKDIGSRALIGLNADRDALKFGSVSPFTLATRKVIIQHPENARVFVVMAGQLQSWTTVTPSNFTVQKDEIKEVQFDVNVPEEALDGNYTGVVVFCFKE